MPVLSIPRYVNTYEPEPDVDLAAVAQELSQLEVELTDVEARMEEYLRELGM